MKSVRNKEKGFTIIEVLIVLAIAGLILLIVFLAVPALQRNSRNTQRKNDVQNVLGSIAEYTNNNNGQLPGNFDDFKGNVGLGFYSDEDVEYVDSIPGSIDPNRLIIIEGAKCDGSSPTANGASSRNIAVAYGLETSSTFDPACQEG